MNGHNWARNAGKRIATLALWTLQLAFATTAFSQTTYYCLPSCSNVDGRFLSLSGSRYSTIAGDQITIQLASPESSTALSFDIFDGETSGVWDGGSAPLVFKLFADPTGDGTGTRKVGEWKGDIMRDSAWYAISVNHDSAARSETGSYHYILKVRIAWGDDNDSNDIEDDAEDAAAYASWSNFKIRSTSNIATNQFAFCAPLFSMREGNIIYPNYPSLSNSTFDGTWSFFVKVARPLSSLEIWDGDMDHGSFNGLANDTDDPNTDSSSVPQWSGLSAAAEGVGRGTDYIRNALGLLTNTLGTGSPLDDNLSASYRRSPSVYYEVTDPYGKVFRNNNPSGNLEWERFVIGVEGLAASPDTTCTYLHQGTYEIKISGMDLHNLNAWRYNEGVVGVSSESGEAAAMPAATCPTNSGRFFSKSTTTRHCMEISEDGEIFTWGENLKGQLGDSTYTDRSTPVQVKQGDYPGDGYLGDDCNGIAHAAHGTWHSMACTHDGTVWAWAKNDMGQQGIGSDDVYTFLSPHKVLKGAYPGDDYLGDDADNPVVRVAVGRKHSVALTSAGIVYTWGYNPEGQCGDNSRTNRHVPVKVREGAYPGTTYLGDNPSKPIIDIAASDRFTLALCADGTVYAFGDNTRGQLGDNSTSERITPVRVRKGAYHGTTYLGDDPDNKITAIAAMAAGGMALAADGTVYTWGWNHDGQLGDNSTTNRLTPVRVLKGVYGGTTYLGDASSNKIVAIASGGDESSTNSHCLAVTAAGRVYAWGSNGYGQLGDNSTSDRRTPVMVVKGAYNGTTYIGDNSIKITDVAAGMGFSLALGQDDNETYAWGSGINGAMGNGSTQDRRTPVKVSRGDRNYKLSGDVENAVVATPSEPAASVTMDAIGVYPEANQVYVTLDASQDSEIIIDLFSTEGEFIERPLESRSIHSGEQRIGLTLPVGLPSGLYFLKLNTESSSVAKHFILSR